MRARSFRCIVSVRYAERDFACLLQPIGDESTERLLPAGQAGAQEPTTGTGNLGGWEWRVAADMGTCTLLVR